MIMEDRDVISACADRQARSRMEAARLEEEARRFDAYARQEQRELRDAKRVKDHSAVPAMFGMAGVLLSNAAWLWWGGFGLLTVGGLLAGAGLLAALGYALLED